MPDFEKNCTAYIREREGWIRWWFGTTKEEAERNFRTNPDGDFTQHLPAKEFTDDGDCTCPAGYDRIVLSDKALRGVARANLKVYRMLDGGAPMIIATQTIERTIPFAYRIRCQKAVATASVEVPTSLRDPEEVATVLASLERKVNLPLELRRGRGGGRRSGRGRARA